SRQFLLQLLAQGGFELDDASLKVGSVGIGQVVGRRVQAQRLGVQRPLQYIIGVEKLSDCPHCPIPALRAFPNIPRAGALDARRSDGRFIRDDSRQNLGSPSKSKILRPAWALVPVLFFLSDLFP